MATVISRFMSGCSRRIAPQAFGSTSQTPAMIATTKSVPAMPLPPARCCAIIAATSASPLAEVSTSRPRCCQTLAGGSTIGKAPSTASARRPARFTASTIARGGTPSGDALTIIRPLSTSNASRSSPPTTGPTSRFNTATSSAQSSPVMRKV